MEEQLLKGEENQEASENQEPAPESLPNPEEQVLKEEVAEEEVPLDPEKEALKLEVEALKKERDELRIALEERNSADLQLLNDEDRQLVEEMGDGDPLKMMKIHAKLLKAGKIASPQADAILSQRVKQESAGQKPATPQQAAQAVINAALKSV